MTIRLEFNKVPGPDSAIVQGSSAEEVQSIIDDMKEVLRYVSATMPVQAADGTYLSMVHFSAYGKEI